MKKTNRIALLSMSALAPLAVAMPTAAAAQDTGASAAASVDDIVVTARKREENLQEVPLAITAFSSEDIQSARIERLSDVAKLTPGLNFTPLFGRQNQLPIIRGAAQTLGQLNVGVFLDGVYLSGKGGVDSELNDLERVEVIKGPQSALYGRNTFAGAINYVTKRPTAELSGRGEITIGDNGLFKGQASISGPLGDTLRFRVGGFYREFNGWYRSSIDGGRVDFEKSYGGIGTLEWQPDDALTVTLRASYSKNDDGQPPSSVIRTNAAPGIPSGAPASQTRNLLYIGEVPSIPRNGVTVNTQPIAGLPGGSYGDREEATRLNATIEYDFGDVTFTSITAYDKRNAEYTYDGENTVCDTPGGCPSFGFPFAPAIPFGASSFALSSNDGYLRDISQELRFASNGNQTVDWLFGVFYYDNVTDGTDRGLSPSATAGPNAYNGFNPNYSFPNSRLTTKSYSVFGSATWNATEQLSITGELRYEYEKQTFRQCPTYYANTTPATVPSAALIDCGTEASPIPSTTSAFTGGLATFDLSQDSRFVTPRVIVNYQATPDALVYASYAKGKKTGGFNTGLNIFDNQRAYSPEGTDNFEVGLKSDLFDRRLRLNIAAYYSDWNNQQAACQNAASLFPPGASSTNRTYTCNVAASTIYGAEVEMTARLTDFFTLSGNYSYTHARYDEFVDDSLALTLAALNLPAIDFDGKRLPYVPDHKVVISPQLNFPVTDAFSLEARADVQYQSRTYLRADNLQSFGDKTVVDLRVTGRLENFYVQLFANNVFDNKVPVAGVRFFDNVNYFVAAPLVTGANRRQIGASVGYSF
jgi:iron complex outermembrane receptor protein